MARRADGRLRLGRAALIGALAAAGAAFGAPGLAAPLSLEGAVMGMTIGAWMALDPPAGEGANAFPDCRRLDAAGRIRGRPLTAADHPSGVVTCQYDARYGEIWLPHSFLLGPNERAHDARFVFAAGRLSEIDFSAATDAATDVVQLIDHECGAPELVRRRTLRVGEARLRQVVRFWRTSDGKVALSDPASADDPIQLSVRMMGPGAPARGYRRSGGTPANLAPSKPGRRTPTLSSRHDIY